MNTTPLKNSISKSFKNSTSWQKFSFRGSVVIYVIGAISIFTTATGPIVPLVLTLVAVVMQLANWWADTLKGDAEKLKRLHEQIDGLGFQPSATFLGSLEVELGDMANAPASEGLNYFNTEAPSPKRALKNLHESSWFTMQLAKKQGQNIVIGSAILCAVGVLLAIFTPFICSGAGEVRNLTQIATALVVSVVSLGLLRQGCGLKSLGERATEISEKAEEMMGKTFLDFEDVSRLLTEYQVERAQAPIVSSSKWAQEKGSLNKTYQKLFPNKNHE